MKLSFKKEPNPFASSLGGHDDWRISFAIKKEPSEKSPAPFKWINMKKKTFETEEEAREAIKRKWKELQEKFDFYQFES